MKSKLEDGQGGFRLSRSTTDQIFEKSWEYDENFFACYVDLNRAYDWVPRENFGRFCGSMALMASCYDLHAMKSFYCRSEVCVRVNGKQSNPFHVDVGLRQGCALSFSCSLLTWIGSTNAAKLMTVPRLEVARSVIKYSLMIWFCFLPHNLDTRAH